MADINYFFTSKIDPTLKLPGKQWRGNCAIFRPKIQMSTPFLEIRWTLSVSPRFLFALAKPLTNAFFFLVGKFGSPKGPYIKKICNKEYIGRTKHTHTFGRGLAGVHRKRVPNFGVCQISGSYLQENGVDIGCFTTKFRAICLNQPGLLRP